MHAANAVFHHPRKEPYTMAVNIRVSSGKDKTTATPVELTKEQSDQIHNAIAKSVVSTGGKEASNWVSFSRN